MKSVHQLFYLILLFSLTACKYANAQDEIIHTIDDPNQRVLLLEKLKEENINYALTEDGIVVDSEDHPKVLKYSMQIYRSFYPRFNSLAIDSLNIRDRVDMLLNKNGINTIKRIKKVEDLPDTYFLILENPEEVCLANEVIRENIGDVLFNTKEVCN